MNHIIMVQGSVCHHPAPSACFGRGTPPNPCPARLSALWACFGEESESGLWPVDREDPTPAHWSQDRITKPAGSGLGLIQLIDGLKPNCRTLDAQHPLPSPPPPGEILRRRFTLPVD
jgi:hypothetical protein